MTKKELLNKIQEVEETLTERIDNANNFSMALLEYLGLDFEKIRVVKEDLWYGEKIVQDYRIFKKTKKSKK